MTLRTLKTLCAQSVSATNDFIDQVRESIIGSLEGCAHSLVSAGINSRTFEILLSVMNCEPFFVFVLDLFWGRPNLMYPKSVYRRKNRPGSGPAHMHMHTHIHMYTHVHTHTHMCRHTHMHIHTPTHTYTGRERKYQSMIRHYAIIKLFVSWKG